MPKEPRARRLNLDGIEASLRAVQGQFDRINAELTTPRDPLSDDVIARMLLGYAYVDGTLLAADVDPFALGESRHLLELNYLVLCGRDTGLRSECRRQMQATEEHFYSKSPGGFEALAEWVQLNRGEPVWRRAAGAYIHVLSQPQLFLEGNHRTGALLMSWMLAREGKPPFVLSVANAKAYFEPSTLAKGTRKHSFRMLIERPKLVKRLGKLLSSNGEPLHVVD